jgi:hypothetical protein
VVDYKAELAADGLDAVSYDGTQIAALIDRLLTSGLTADEEQNLRNIGFADADLTFLFDRISALPRRPIPSRAGCARQSPGID